MNDNIRRLRLARNTLHRLEDRGMIDNSLSMEQITAIRIAEFAIDEICDKTADVQPVDRWISVKDKLPDEMQDRSDNSSWSKEIRPSEDVLILTTGGSYDVAWYSYTFNDWTSGTENYSYQNWEVAFWQPLPEPPEAIKG